MLEAICLDGLTFVHGAPIARKGVVDALVEKIGYVERTHLGCVEMRFYFWAVVIPEKPSRHALGCSPVAQVQPNSLTSLDVCPLLGFSFDSVL